MRMTPGLLLYIVSVMVAFVAGYWLRAYLAHHRRLMYGGRSRD